MRSAELLARVPTAMLTRPFAAALAPSAFAFARDVHDPHGAQTQALAGVVQELSSSRRHPTLRNVRTLADLQSAAPLTCYEDYARDLDDAAGGTKGVLARAAIMRFERSGGSSGAQKLLPQSKPFLAEMDRALHPWLFDLYARVPGVASGCAYWSISPMGNKRAVTAGGIPIGAEDDASYFPAPIRALLARVLAVPSSVARLADVDACRFATLRALCARPDLALISVWSPTFLTLLLDELERSRSRLARALSDDGHAHAARTLDGSATGPELVRTLWPKLALVSMWTDGASAAFVHDVKRRVGDVPVQPKGLLATEGVVSIPWQGVRVLAIRSHVLELLEERPDGTLNDARPRFAHEVEVGRTYQVALTTSAGLVRYRLGDRVEVTGAHQATPTVRFLGRGGVVSDLVGEKLALERVAAVLSEEVRGASFAMLAPAADRRGYVLFVDAEGDVEVLASRVEARLCEGHPYRYARQLGQLQPLRVVRVREAVRRYEAACIARGQRAGDIKLTPLHLAGDWEETLA